MSKVILCFGDSNTHGTPPMTSEDDCERFDARTRWPGVMRGLLPGDWTVIEEGLPGRTTTWDDPAEGKWKNGLRGLRMLIETHRPIDLVVVMLGTNDLKARFGLTRETLEDSLATLCKVLDAKRAEPGHGALDALLVAPPPVREIGPFAEMFEGAEEKSTFFAPVFESVARERGAGFLDAGAHIAVCEEDGIHFDAAAHGTLGRIMAGVVQDRLS